MIILDETLQEEDSETRKEGQGKGTDGTKIGGGRWDSMEKEERRTQQQ